MVQDAVIRNLEVIGEAVKNLSSDFRRLHPEIPWRSITALRNVLIHEYFGVDLEIVWRVVTRRRRRSSVQWNGSLRQASAEAGQFI
jgi:uncharacterized protein with HEPN domain